MVCILTHAERRLPNPRETYLGHEEHLDQVTVGHEELGDEVDVVVARGVSQLSRRGLSRPELVVQVGEVERRALSSVVVVAVHVQDLRNPHEYIM